MVTSVQVISREIIKPSSQTRHHLKNLKLSVLDQLAPPVYTPLIFFYDAKELKATTTLDQISQNLKQSLSNSLTVFYPLAGNLNQETFAIDCNDAGVMYVEARVNARIQDTIQDPKTEELSQFLPVSVVDFTDNYFLAVQTNFFDCGGIAIGVCLWHQIADGVSFMAFMNYWAATCRGTNKVQVLPNPRFNLADHFPDLGESNIPKSSLLVPLTTKRFVFDKDKLAALREAATSTESTNAVKDPTRVELVSSFIWKSFIEAAKSKNINSIFVGSQAVNMRQRAVPPERLEHVFGNCYANQLAVFGDYDKVIRDPEFHDLVRGFRNTIREVNDEYIRKSQRQDEDGYLSVYNKGFNVLLQGGVEFCGFSSWCGFRVYEVDYGWGKPVWVGTTPFPLLNFTLLMNNRSGDGVEAWINAVPENIETLESHFQLL